MMEKHRILGIHITDRVRHVPDVQTALTKFGCNIRTRLGLHEARTDTCSPNGLILIEVVGDDAEAVALKKALTDIEGVDVQEMLFDHP